MFELSSVASEDVPSELILMVQVSLVSVVVSTVVGDVVRLLSADSVQPSSVMLDRGDTVARPVSSKARKFIIDMLSAIIYILFGCCQCSIGNFLGGQQHSYVRREILI